VEKIELGAWVHIHMADGSAWRYVVLVEKTSQPTPKQALNQVANTENNRNQHPTCGVP